MRLSRTLFTGDNIDLEETFEASDLPPFRPRGIDGISDQGKIREL
jgi:hypothetical protein